MSSRNIDENRNYVAPQNSITESFKVPRYNINPYIESNSAPATVHTTPLQRSREVSKDTLGKVSSKLSQVKQNSSASSTKETNGHKQRVPKYGISIDNDLKSRLYDNATSSQVLQHAKYSPHKPSNTSKRVFTTFMAGRRGRLVKEVKKLEENIDVASVTSNSTTSSDEELSRRLSTTSSSSSNITSSELVIPISPLVTPTDESIMSSRQIFLNKSILDIIHELFKRLNWPCSGVLQGDVPVGYNQNIDTTMARKEDDGEFVYCLPRDYFSLTARYNPYDLVFVGPKKAQACDTYYTVSATYVSKVSKKEGTILVYTLDWIYERKKFDQIYQLKVFKQFKTWKAFMTWKRVLRHEKTEESRGGIEKVLFMVNLTFQDTILQIRKICDQLCELTLSDNKYETLLNFDVNKTYELSEFCELQRRQCKKVKDALMEHRKDILQLLIKACQKFYAESTEEIDESVRVIEHKEMLRKSGQKQQKQYKNFQVIKEKYNIVEHDPPEDPNLIAAEKKKISFKHVKIVHMKTIHKRIQSFVRMIDFIIVDMLRTLVLTAIKVFQAQLAASYQLDNQPNFLDMYRWECSQSKTFHSLIDLGTTKSLFYVNLVLNPESVIQNKKDELVGTTDNGIEKKIKCSSSLCPSEEDFEQKLSNLFHEFESIVLSFKSLSSDPLLQELLQEPVSVKMDEKPINKHKLDADLTLLFGEDAHYQGCLTDIMGNLRNGMKQVKSYVKQFDVFCNMVTLSNISEVKESLQKEWSTEQFYVVLNQYSEQVSAMDTMPISQRKTIFTVKTDGFKASCLPYPKDIIYIVNEYLPKVANNKNEGLLKIIKGGERNLSAPIKTVEDFVEHLSYLSRIAEDIPKLEKEYNIISRLFFIAFKYDADFTAEEKALYQTLAPSFQQLKALVMYCEANKDENIHKYSKDLDSIVDNLTKQLHNLTIQIRNPSLLDEDISPANALENIKYLKDDFEELTASAKSFSSYESTFTSALSSSVKKRYIESQAYQSEKSSSKVIALQEELSDVEKDLMLRKLLWESIEEWGHLHNAWRVTAFSELDITYLHKEMSRLVQAAYLLEKGLPSNSLVPILKKKIMMFKLGMPVISSLRNPALKHRHWKEINNITGITVREDKQFTLGNLIDMELFQHQEEISEISTQASNEATLEQMLNKVKEFWKIADLQLLAHTNRDIAIITGVDDILTSLDDSLVTLANIRGSRYCLPLQTQINEWDRKLNLFLRTFEEWILVQRHWLYLETVFSASDIQRQLPNEAKLFSQVDKNWRDIMRRTIDRPNAIMAATSAGLLDVLQACNSNLEKIHRSLEDYLETKRLVFSRFYFLSNDELLDILASSSKNVSSVQPYLSKCFANLKNLKFNLQQKSPVPICGMESMEGEYMELPKSLRARGQVEQWLVSVESAMFDTVKSQVKKALPQFSHDDLMEWILSNYGQVILTVIQVIFCADVNDALIHKQTSEEIQIIIDKLIYKLDILADYVKKKMMDRHRNVAVALIITLVHARDIVQNLQTDKVDMIDDFQWIRQLRYRWDENSNNCFVEQSISSFVYGYEYLGCSSRLVITPLTDRCYLTLTGALHFHLGGAPIGPAGTGKSETVKDLAKNIGKHCIIFNCSEGIDFKMIGKFLSGISQSGSWCCFDEFNRIDREVLSVIAQQLHIIRTAKMSNSIRFMFESRDLRLNTSSGVFITMNPGYAGRVELPDNLKSMFRPVSMVTPDNTLIAEIILFSNGFTMAAILSHKLVKVYEFSNKQLSHQHHYDFGLRAIKAVLLMAGESNRNSISDHSSTNVLNEEAILIQAICDSNYPKLVSDDRKIFQQFLEDIFPGASKQLVSQVIPLEKSIGIALRELSLQKSASQVEKVIQFQNTLNVRHGVMLVGPTAGGKTTVRKLLKRSLVIREGGVRVDGDDTVEDNKEKSKVVDMITINPKSLTLGELYGEFDSNTTEWTDGLLSSSVRRFVTENSDHVSDEQKSPSKMKHEDVQAQDILSSTIQVKSKHQWLVLDGPVDTLWVENLNTMLDDSKLLCLANGERISMLPTMRVIFEVDNLAQASPATISRCGMVYLDPSELGWKPTVKSWLRKLRDIKVPDRCRDHLWKLFETTIEPGNQFLKEHQKFRLINVPLLSMVQMICNLLDAFLKFLNKNGGFGNEENNIVENEENQHEVEEENENLLFDFSNLVFDYSNKVSKETKPNNLLLQNPEMVISLLSKLYMFSFMWAFGGHFECLSEEAEEMDRNAYVPNFQTGKDVNIRHIFDTFIRNLFENNFDMHLPGGTNLLYSYYVDMEKGQFLLWDHLVINATIQLEKVLSQSVLNNIDDQPSKTSSTGKGSLIPTPHTICYSFLVALLSLNDCPVLLSGPTGLGKTVLLQDVFQRLSQPGGCAITPTSILGTVLPCAGAKVKNLHTSSDHAYQNFVEDFQNDLLVSQVTFSALTDAETPKKALQSGLVKRGRNVLCSKHGEKVIVFVDDLNMPIPETFGSQPPLEVLREYVDYGGFYDTKHLQWKEVYNVTLMAACGINANGHNINERLIQKFNTLCLPLPSSQSLHHIYYTQLSRFVDSCEFSTEVRSLRSDIISTILGIYHEISTTLKITPAKSHYLFDLRDISKVVKGLMHAHATVIKTKDNFIELLINEVSRVFLDRLICESDRNYFMDVLIDQIHDFLKIKWSKDRLCNHTGIFADFFEPNVLEQKRVYQCIRDQNKLRQIIEDYHDRGKLSGKPVPEKLVLFPAMCQHIVSAARVLRQQGGHLLLLGIGGTGKTSVIQLASYMEFCEFVHPAFTRNYNIADFTEDVKKVMLKAGIHGIKVVLFINDINIVKESFLEIVCNVLNASNLSTFFDAESKENIAMELKSEAVLQDVADNVDSTFEFFSSRVRQNLHIVFSTSPSGALFHQRCQMYPSLVNNCTIDFYSKWPSEALYTVADEFLSSEDLLPNITKSLAEIMVSTHENCDLMCQRFHDELKRHYHVTPKSFLNFFLLFKSTYKSKTMKLHYKKERLISGLQKIDETNSLVVEMKTGLISLGPKLEQKAKDTEDIMKEILKDQEQINKVRAVVKKEQEVTDRETKKVEAIAMEAQKDLDSALPQLEAATAALDSLNKYDIGEIRSYANPPLMVMTVLSAVCVILNDKPDWPTAKLLLADPNFLKKLITFDHENISDKIHTRLKKYTKQEDFNPSTVGKISVACKSMCSWVLALENYTTVSRMVKPKQLKCEQAQEALREAREKLMVKEMSLKKVEDQLKALQDGHDDSMNQLKSLQDTKELTIQRLERAALLIKALTSEQGRWSSALKHLDSDTDCLLSESLILSASASYLGPFTPTYRTTFVQTLIEKIHHQNIKVVEDFDLIRLMTDPVQVQDWRNSGLPHDNHSTQNALFIKHTFQWPFIIDPQQQAMKWIKGKEKENIVKIIKANDSNLMRTVENSIRLGETVIIQNASTILDPALDPILHRNVTMRGNQSIITLGGTEIQYNQNFQLYILTNIENPKLLPELCIKVSVVNFIITMEGLTDQVLSKVVQQENPELEKELNEVLEFLVHEQFRLTELEDQSLNLLHSSKGNILDDKSLIETLDKSNHIAERIKQKVIDAEQTQLKLSKKREIYLPLAERGALLYFIASDLSAIDSMYQFSLSWFMDLFRKCIDIPMKDTSIECPDRPSSARTRINQAKEYALSSDISKRKITMGYTLDNHNDATYIKMMTPLVTETFYKVVSYALFARHQLLFAFHLTSKIILHENEKGVSKLMSREKYQFMLNVGLNDVHENVIESDKTENSSTEKEYAESQMEQSPLSLITATQWNECIDLSTAFPCFIGLCKHIHENSSEWGTLMNASKPFEILDKMDKIQSSPFEPKHLNHFEKLLLIKTLRPDQFVESITSFITFTMGKQFTTPSGFDLQDLYAESNCRTPIMFILSPGSDPSSGLFRFVKEVRGSALHLDMISLGRSQGQKALEAIKKAYMQRGNWVFLQNCHLALSFMSKLEETVRDLSDPDVSVNPQFRLWLSSKPDVMLPVSILQSSMKVTVEPPPGVKNSLQNSFAAVGGVVSENLFEECSIHKSWKQLVYSACFFHAVVQERKKFGSLGWNLRYDFISSDLEVAVLTLQDIVSQSTNIPWSALQLLSGEIIYGGRVTDQWDQRCLLSLLKRFYSPELLENDFTYLYTKDYSPPSNESSFYDCIELIENFAPIDPPDIFGMNENAMYERNREEGFKLINDLLVMQPNSIFTRVSKSFNDDYIVKRIDDILKMIPKKIEIIIPKSPSKASSNIIRTKSSNQLRSASRVKSARLASRTDVKKEIPIENTLMPVAVDISTVKKVPTSALLTALEQEQRRFNTLLSTIINSLDSLKQGLKGELLLTEKLEKISLAISYNKVPLEWKACSFISNKSLSSWLSNLRSRIEFVKRWIESIMVNDPAVVSPPRAIWLPALFYPQGMRQVDKTYSISAVETTLAQHLTF